MSTARHLYGLCLCVSMRVLGDEKQPKKIAQYIEQQMCKLTKLIHYHSEWPSTGDTSQPLW